MNTPTLYQVCQLKVIFFTPARAEWCQGEAQFVGAAWKYKSRATFV